VHGITGISDDGLMLITSRLPRRTLLKRSQQRLDGEEKKNPLSGGGGLLSEWACGSSVTFAV
jgi:hypothetical protein